MSEKAQQTKLFCSQDAEMGKTEKIFHSGYFNFEPKRYFAFKKKIYIYTYIAIDILPG